MKWYNRFYLKVFASIYISILITITCLSIIFSYLMADFLKETTYAELKVDSITLKKQLDLNLTFVETTIKQIAESDAVIRLNMERVNELSQHLVERMDIISQIYIMDSSGMQIYKTSYSETLGDRTDRDYFQKAINGTAVFSDVIISRSTNIPITVYATPIYRDGRIDGVIGCSIDLSYLSELSSTLRANKDSYGFIIDLAGHVIGHPDPEIVAERTDVSDTPFVQDILAGKSGIDKYSYEGVEKLVAYTTSDRSGWGVLVQIPEKEAYETISIINKLIITIAVIILLISLIAVYIVSHRLHKPVDNIIEIIDRIEKDQELQEDTYYKNNEFEVIRKKLLSMNYTIKQHYLEIEERVELRTAELKKTLSELDKTRKKLEKANKKLNQMSLTDELTNLPNRRALNEHLTNMISISQRLDFKFAVLMMDIDYFKIYNDTYGHQKGDDCLVKISKCLSENIRRKMDFLARYGGEEFIVILGDITLEGAGLMANKLCRKVEELYIPNEGNKETGLVTISIGLAWAPSLENTTTENMILMADNNLYKAKQTGRNRFV